MSESNVVKQESPQNIVVLSIKEDPSSSSQSSAGVVQKIVATTDDEQKFYATKSSTVQSSQGQLAVPDPWDASRKKYEIVLPVKEEAAEGCVRELPTIVTEAGATQQELVRLYSEVDGTQKTVLQRRKVAQIPPEVLKAEQLAEAAYRSESKSREDLEVATLQTHDVSGDNKHQVKVKDFAKAQEAGKEDAQIVIDINEVKGEHSGATTLKKFRRSGEDEERKENRQKYLKFAESAISDEDEEIDDLFFDNDPDFNPENDDDDEWGVQKLAKKKKVSRGGGGGRGRGRPRGRGSPRKETLVRRSTAYKDEWEQDRRLSDWLAPGKSGSKAWCRACLTHLKPNKNELIAHAASDRHKQRLKKLVDEPDAPPSKEGEDLVAEKQETSESDLKPRRSRPKKVRVKFSDEEEDENDAELEDEVEEKGAKRKSESDDEYLEAYKKTDGKPPKKKKKNEHKEEEEEESIPIMEFEAVLAIEETMMMQQEEHKAQMAFLQRKMECEEEELNEEIKILKEQNMLLMMQKHNEQINNQKLHMEISRMQAGLNTFSVVTYDTM